MKAAIAAPVLALALAVAVPAASGAMTTQRAQVRLRQTQAALAGATADLARLRSELASPQVQAGTLRAEAARLHAGLVRAAARLRAAQAQLAETPSALTVAVQQVRREVAYVQGGVPYVPGQLIAEAAMDYVVGHVSDTAYGYLQLSGAALPPVRANAALTAQAGICGQAAVAFAAIVSRLGVEARSVQFFYDDPSADAHVGVEVLYGGSWHYFDPTYGQFWTDGSGDVLSISDVRNGQGTLQKDVASFTNVFEDAVYGNDTWFETDPATKLVVGAWVRTPSRP